MRKLSGYAVKVLKRLADGHVMQDVSGAVFVPSSYADLAMPVMYVRTPTIRSLENKGLLKNASKSRLKVFTISEAGQEQLQRLFLQNSTVV